MYNNNSSGNFSNQIIGTDKLVRSISSNTLSAQSLLHKQHEQLQQQHLQQSAMLDLKLQQNVVSRQNIKLRLKPLKIMPKVIF